MHHYPETFFHTYHYDQAVYQLPAVEHLANQCEIQPTMEIRNHDPLAACDSHVCSGYTPVYTHNNGAVLGAAILQGNTWQSGTYAMSLGNGLESFGTKKTGKLSRKMRLTPSQRAAIVELDSVRDPRQRMTQAQIARLFGTSRSAISKILRPSSVEKIRKNYAAHFNNKNVEFIRSDTECTEARSDLDSSYGGEHGFWGIEESSPSNGRCMVEFLVSTSNDQSCRVIPLWLDTNWLGEPFQGYRKLVEAVIKEFGLDVAFADTMRLFYQDADGDNIIVSSDHELGIAMKHFPAGLYVRMNVQLIC
ncbi:hypothetical protein GUITHDRAFT_145464 [Guillardia theta CCMP2712]|uniref:PB1 domain-containing protein n=1 Tax=Guillardia theta (strain CCMP2712) TaxID=905079 RepID=L1IKT8_GUITC|nr:hypothetical protein GUITHDRAFT_145464 [Guillardia theta CCMP2712]EKX36841.1 hypothetical protein GUITHDRAFT_145464 [Guillardia theta CCMP2712]|eukprot:XP_005823821.1 hypothetical protein GUITHDRAFT_145464 [Guillardia theta CCMP2712]